MAEPGGDQPDQESRGATTRWHAETVLLGGIPTVLADFGGYPLDGEGLHEAVNPSRHRLDPEPGVLSGRFPRVVS